MRKLIPALALSVALTSHPALAQDGKLGIHIAVTTEDPVGRRLAFRFRDAVGRSGAFREVAAGEKGFKASLVTLDPTKDGQMTVYSLALLIPRDEGLDYFVTSYVGVCGQDKLQACAQDMLEGIGEEAEKIRQAISRTSF